MTPPVSFLAGRHTNRSTASFAALFGALCCVVSVSCGPEQVNAPPAMVFENAKQVHHQRETVTVKMQSTLAPKEFVQIWIRADDNLWYPCGAAKRDPASGAWKAPCQFGSDKHPAHEGAQFVLGAFYTTNRVDSEYLPDSIWYLLKTQQTQPVVFNRAG
jgi:hypothetical protein